MLVAFRVDASREIGTGHVMRCLALAEYLKKHMIRVRFIARHMPLYLLELIISKGFEFKQLSSQSDGRFNSDLQHAEWLGTSHYSDAEDTIAALADKKWDWLIVDHYGLDYQWELMMRGCAQKLLVIDDIADRQHACEVLLDQNFYMDMQTRYINKVPSHCNLLLGPNYALLRSEFGALRQQIKHRSGAVKNILVFFGGIDADNFTGTVLQLLADLVDTELHVDVVIGAQHPNLEQIQELCFTHEYVCHIQTIYMAKLMSTADLAIGAGGSASWERCCLGLPSLLIPIAKNQVNIAKALDLIGACVYVEPIDIINIKTIITNLINNQRQLELLSERSFALVDGQGVHRVYQVLVS